MAGGRCIFVADQPRCPGSVCTPAAAPRCAAPPAAGLPARRSVGAACPALPAPGSAGRAAPRGASVRQPGRAARAQLRISEVLQQMAGEGWKTEHRGPCKGKRSVAVAVAGKQAGPRASVRTSACVVAARDCASRVCSFAVASASAASWRCAAARHLRTCGGSSGGSPLSRGQNRVQQA